jgi:hypothetical protein
MRMAIAGTSSWRPRSGGKSMRTEASPRNKSGRSRRACTWHQRLATRWRPGALRSVRRAVEQHFAVSRDPREARLNGRGQFGHVLQKQGAAARTPRGCRARLARDRSCAGDPKWETADTVPEQQLTKTWSIGAAQATTTACAAWLTTRP